MIKMISLIHYKEFGPGMSFPSMRDSFAKEPYKGMEEIAKYLEGGKPTFAQAHIPKDFFTGEIIPVESTGMTDGEFSWMSVLPYYVRKYYLRLPADFEKKVLNS